MSLSRTLDQPGVRAALANRIRKPAFPASPIRVPLRGDNPARVGIAFDYALRYGLFARGWADEPDTVAASAVEVLRRYPDLGGDAAEARRICDQAIATLIDAESDGFGEAAARACYDLAGLDVVFRARRAEQVGQFATDRELEDLKALIEIVPWAAFQPKQRLVLNPTFGDGSRAVGGADADLVLDDCVVEIKVISQSTVPVEAVRQVVGYALLSRRYGIDGASLEPRIGRIGVYLARSGVLVSASLAEAIDLQAEAAVLELIIDAAEP